MANIYGNANPLALPAVYTPTGDITCTSSTAVTVITTGAIKALDNQSYYPLIWVVLTMLFGAAAPSALTVKFILGAGSAVDTYTVEPALLVALTEEVIAVPLIGASSDTAWSGNGSTINIQVTGTGQASTCKQVGSRAIVSLNRGP